MRATQSVGHLAAAALSLSSLSAAWPAWPRWLPELDSLIARADDPPATAATPSTSSTSKFAAITTNLNTAGLTATGSSNGTGTSGTATKTGNSTSHTTFDPTNPVGSVVMTKPAATDGTQLYKINDYVTFGWNYTNLLATPTAVDVVLSCSTVSATWTLTANWTFETQATYVWDTKQFQSDNLQSQLPIAEYTLLVYDADSSISATAEAGYLAPYSGLRFGMYTPKAYTSLADWTCATCSAAMSEMERRGLGAVFMMCIVTVLSFTWFVTGFAGLAI